MKTKDKLQDFSAIFTYFRLPLKTRYFSQKFKIQSYLRWLEGKGSQENLAQNGRQIFSSPENGSFRGKNPAKFRKETSKAYFSFDLYSDFPHFPVSLTGER